MSYSRQSKEVWRSLMKVVSKTTVRICRARNLSRNFLEPNQGTSLFTYAISSLDVSKYHAIFYTGGHGTMWDFPNDSILNAAAQKLYANGGVLAAICHGSAGLLNLKNEKNEYLISGKVITGFSNEEEEACELTKVVPYLLEDELKKRGAKYQNKAKFTSLAVSDSRIITGQNPQSSIECARAVVKQLSKTYYGKDEPIVEVIIIVTNHTTLGTTGKKTGWYLPEVAHPYYHFVESGYKVTFASAKGGLAAVDANSVTSYATDEECAQFYGTKCDKDGNLDTVAISALNHKNYHAIVYTGGHGTMWDFPNDKFLQTAAEAIYNNGGIVGSICHGPAGILNLKDGKGVHLVKGKKVTGFSNAEEEEAKLTSIMPFLLEDELTKRGGVYSKAAKLWESHVVSDGRLITGQNPASGRKFGEEVIKAINTQVLK